MDYNFRSFARPNGEVVSREMAQSLEPSDKKDKLDPGRGMDFVPDASDYWQQVGFNCQGARRTH